MCRCRACAETDPIPLRSTYHEVLARPNTLVSEPSNAPASASRFFVNDLNGVLYILDKKTKKFIPYIAVPRNVSTDGYGTLCLRNRDHSIRSRLRA